MKMFIIGDSYTYGHGVTADQTVPSYLQEMLRDAGYDIAVVNAGVSGYSPGQEYIYLKDFIIPAFHPKWVVWRISASDEGDMRRRSMHFLRKDRLIRVPGWTNGIYIQGLLRMATPRFLKKSLFLNLLISSLGNVDPVWWLQEPLKEDSRKKIKLMVEDIERQGVVVLVTMTPTHFNNMYPSEMDPEDFFFEFGRLFTHFINERTPLRDWVIRKGALEGLDTKVLADKLRLPKEDDPNRHLTSLGNELCARAIFDYIKAGGMGKLPMKRIK